MAYHLYFRDEYQRRKKKLLFNLAILFFAMVLNIISLVYTVSHGPED